LLFVGLLYDYLFGKYFFNANTPIHDSRMSIHIAFFNTKVVFHQI